MPDASPFPVQFGEVISPIEITEEYDPILQRRPTSWSAGKDLTITGTTTDTGGHNDVDDDSDSD